MILKDKIINFLGDSITEGAGASAINKAYVTMVKELFGLKQANNYGIGGTRIAVQRKPTEENPNFDRYFASRIEEMDENADAVVVFGGTNDYGHGDACMGKFTDRTPDTFYGACHDLFSRLIERFPGKPIVVVTPLHRLNEEGMGTADIKEKNFALSEYVDIIKEVACYYSLPVCDLFANSGLQPNIPVIQEKFMPDGLHPNDAGHYILAERIGGFLTCL